MSIIDEQNKRKKAIDLNSKAIEMYNDQVKAITGIANTEGFKEILNYWQRELDSCKEMLTNCKTEDLIYIQARYASANGFLVFLNNLNKLET